MVLLLSYLFIHTEKKLENIHKIIDYNQSDNYGGKKWKGRDEGGGGGGEWKELVPATEPRDFHILQTLSTSELHLRSWKSLIYPLPIYLCFLISYKKHIAFIATKKKKGCYFQYLYATFSGWGPPEQQLVVPFVSYFF